MRATEQAALFVRQMVHDETLGWGDEAGALRRISHNSKVPFWTLNNLRINRAKTIDADVWGRIREYFIQHCQRHAGRLLEQAEIAQRVAPANDELRTVADQIRALALRLENAKGDPKGAVIPRQE